MTLAGDKKRLRAEMAGARRRAAADPGPAARAVRDRFLARFGDRVAGAGVSAYWPIGDELDPLPLLHALAGRGAVCALPAVIGPGRPLAFRRWRPGDALVEARFGLSEPPGTAPPVAPDIVVAPLLAVDRAGRRLGYGGGYYDRTIAALRCRGAVLVVGIGYDVQIRPSVPEGADDRRVDWVVSEKRIFECSEDT
ncbi:MAG: 5-formyltetrahydrofolate cyclo-ligase [Defluviicoccus sp.]|nr:5-formyltetrahydrofolate cyclo-ligase [Defluviicoccus sp.]